MQADTVLINSFVVSDLSLEFHLSCLENSLFFGDRIVPDAVRDHHSLPIDSADLVYVDGALFASHRGNT